MRGFALETTTPRFDLPLLSDEEDEMQGLKNKGQHDRSKINMHEPREVQYWTKHLKVSQEELQKAVDKVGNSAAAVRKELAG
jgi:Protein of unknown function (DUF3606)